MNRPFAGLWLPLITPFSNHQIDHQALRRLVTHYAALGLTGLVVCGTTGEAAALSTAEQHSALQTVQVTLKSLHSDLPVIMGVSGYHLEDTCSGVRQLRDLVHPPSGLLVSAPHYIRPSQQGLKEWFTRIADAAQCPVILYDIPYRTGVSLDLDTLRHLGKHPAIVAVKDCGGDPAKTQHLIGDGQLSVLAGDDVNIFSTLALGGAGAIAASLHLETHRMVALARHLALGEWEAARAQWFQMLPLISALFEEPNPGPIKSLLAAQGLIANELRAPMTTASPALVSRLQSKIAALRLQ